MIIAAVIRGVFGASSRLRVMFFNYFLLVLARAFILAGVWALWCLGASLIFANFLTLILKYFFFFFPCVGTKPHKITQNRRIFPQPGIGILGKILITFSRISNVIE